MKITTLGTSHGSATYCRFNSSTLYEIGGILYLIDAGEPADGLLTRLGIRASSLRAVFVTHMHGDHAAGLDALVKAMCKYRKEEKLPEIFLPEEGAAEALAVWMHAIHVNPERGAEFRVTREGVIYDDGNLRVTAVPTGHMTWSTHEETPCFAYILEAEGKRILHTGDLRGDFSDFPGGDGTWDLCVCEATHFQMETAVPLMNRARYGRMIFTHIANRWHGEEGEKALLAAVKELPCPVSIAHDGDAFIL